MVCSEQLGHRTRVTKIVNRVRHHYYTRCARSVVVVLLLFYFLYIFGVVSCDTCLAESSHSHRLEAGVTISSRITHHHSVTRLAPPQAAGAADPPGFLTTTKRPNFKRSCGVSWGSNRRGPQHFFSPLFVPLKNYCTL